MRTFSFIVLFGGFLWLCWDSFSIRPITRAVVVTHYERLPEPAETTFSREDVMREIREVTFDAVEHYPSFMLPALVMLAGGLLLAFAPKRSVTQPNGLTNRSSEPAPSVTAAAVAPAAPHSAGRSPLSR